MSARRATVMLVTALALAAACSRPETGATARADDGCSTDTECKGDRICEQRRCVAPPITGTPACPPCPACADPPPGSPPPPASTSTSVTGPGLPAQLDDSPPPAKGPRTQLEKARALLLDHPDQAKLLLYDRLTKGGSVDELNVLKQACKATQDIGCVKECQRRLGQM